MIVKLISDFKRSRYRSFVISFLVTVAFIVMVGIVVLIISTIVTLLLPFIGETGTVLLVGFLFLWLFVYNLIEK